MRKDANSACEISKASDVKISTLFDAKFGLLSDEEIGTLFGANVGILIDVEISRLLDRKSKCSKSDD